MKNIFRTLAVTAFLLCLYLLPPPAQEVKANVIVSAATPATVSQGNFSSRAGVKRTETPGVSRFGKFQNTAELERSSAGEAFSTNANSFGLTSIKYRTGASAIEPNYTIFLSRVYFNLPPNLAVEYFRQARRSSPAKPIFTYRHWQSVFRFNPQNTPRDTKFSINHGIFERRLFAPV